MNGAVDALGGLRDVRLPDGTAAIADGLAGVSVGLAVALLGFALLGVFFHRPVSRREIAVAQLRASRRLDPGERLLGLARLVGRLAAERDPDGRGWFRSDSLRARERESLARLQEEIRGVLYRPDAASHLDRLDSAVAGLIERMRG